MSKVIYIYVMYAVCILLTFVLSRVNIKAVLPDLRFSLVL